MVLDEAQIEKLTAEDKEFIEEFKNLEMLSFNLTKISSLDNFPTLPSLKRVSKYSRQFKEHHTNTFFNNHITWGVG